MCGIRAYSEFQLRSREGASFAASAAAQMNKAILLNLRRYDACGLYDVGTAHLDDVTVWETLTSWSLCLDHFYVLLLEISTISISRCVCFHLIVIKGKCEWGARGRGGGGMHIILPRFPRPESIWRCHSYNRWCAPCCIYEPVCSPF